MQDPDRVQVLQPRGDVNQYLHRLGFGQREGDICQRALGPGHDQEQGIACVSRVDHRQEHVAAAFGDALADIALAAQEALVERALRALLADHLDRHRRPVIGFTRINAAEAAGLHCLTIRSNTPETNQSCARCGHGAA